jgi:hypothetical protein
MERFTLRADPMRANAAAGTDLVITIPPRLSFGETAGPWKIRHAVDKLKRKYGDFLESREFDGYSAERAIQDSSWRNRLEMADLLITCLMQSQIEKRPAVIDALMERRPGIEAAMLQVPDGLALELDIPELVWQKLETLFREFRVKGVSLATITKVLCLKRPALIPMLDNHVMRFLFKGGRPCDNEDLIQPDAAVGVMGMKQFRQLMLHGENLKALAWVRDALNPWLNSLKVSSRVAPAPSLVRVLDSLLWYDWDGHSHFGKLESRLPVPALVALLREGDHAARWRAAKCLGEAGPAAQESVSSLIEVLKVEGEDSLIGWWCAEALKKIDPKAAARVGFATATTDLTKK